MYEKQNKNQNKRKKKLITWRFWLLLPLLPCVYVFSILFFVYSNVWNSGLEGGGNGPADAYRHSLSSALVAHTLSPKIVHMISNRMENGGRGLDSHVMDQHNNFLGARVGDSVPLSFNSVKEVNKRIQKLVDNRKTNTTDPNQIYILPEHRWVNRRYH